MKNHSCPPRCSKGLKSICGTAIDIDDVDFGPTQNHLLYVDKVYSKGEGTACPLVFNITTCPSTFQSQLLMAPMSQNIENLCEEIFGDDCNCGCEHERNCNCDCGCSSNDHQNCCVPCCNTVGAGTCQLDENAVFKIVKSHVRIRSFDTTAPCSLSPCQVTIDGNPVDSLTCQGGAYEASIRNSVPNIVKKTCLDNCMPTKAFFLITGAGPWSFLADFVLEGTVTTGGSSCCFRAIFSTKCPQPISTSLSNLAVPKVSIPCISGGIAPRLFFNFSGKMNLLNPSITVVENERTESLSLSLCSAVAAEPTVKVEVVKKSLFCINGCEALFPCEGTEEFVENEEDDDDDDLHGSDCHCGCDENHSNCHDRDDDRNRSNRNRNHNRCDRDDNCNRRDCDDNRNRCDRDDSCNRCDCDDNRNRCDCDDNCNRGDHNHNCGCGDHNHNCGCDDNEHDHCSVCEQLANNSNSTDCTNSLPYNASSSCSSCCKGY